MKASKTLLLAGGILLSTSAASLAQTFTFDIQQPATNALVGDSLVVRVSVASTYELQSVSATVADRSSNLVFSLAGGSVWTNTLSLAGLPYGEKTLTIVATDLFAATGQTQRVVLHDLPPTLTVVEPREGTVARPDFPIQASAADDGPGGIIIHVSCGTNLLATGTNAVSAFASMPDKDGQTITIHFTATDSSGQTAALDSLVNVFTNTNWVEVARMDGPIFDFTTNRVLFKSGDTLKIRSRTAGTDTTIFGPGANVVDGQLIPDGALFSDYPASPIWNVYKITNGILTSLGQGNQIQFNGNHHAIWYSAVAPSLFVHDLLAGTITQLDLGFVAGRSAFLAPNGDVVYLNTPHQADTYNIIRYRDGTSTLLASSFLQYQYGSPQTDGTNVLYSRRDPGNPRVMRHDGSTETVLSTNALSYGINAGWMAFNTNGPGGVAQLWTISPGDDRTQRTFFGADSRLVMLAPNGELLFRSGEHLYLSRLAQPPRDLGPWGFTAFRWLEGRWYLTIGRSLFRLYRPLTLAPAGFTADGKLKINLQAEIGDQIITQTSTNLVNWSDIMTNTISGSSGEEVTAPAAAVSEGARYFRTLTRD